MIALYKGRSLLSRLIRWRTWSEYSHAAWVCPDGSVIEAWKGGVRHAPGPLVQHEPGTEVDLFEVKGLCVAKAWRVQEFLLRQIGKPYDYAGILGFVLAAKTENPDCWFCSELVFAALKGVGVELLSRVPPWKVSPGMLAVSPFLKSLNAPSMFTPCLPTPVSG
jgi:uncharacterized protein YycO